MRQSRRTSVGNFPQLELRPKTIHGVRPTSIHGFFRVQERIDYINNIIEKTKITKYNLAKILGYRVNSENIILDKSLNNVSEEDIVYITNV